MSSAEQVQTTSLAQQEHECRLYCERQGFDVAGVFVDKGESAKTADRPEFQRMVSFCNSHDVTAAVVWKLDRFSRSSYDHAVFQAVLAKAGVEVQSVTEPLSDSPAGKLLQTMLAGIAQFDNDVRAERSRSGMKAIAQAGGWTQKAPVGYVLTRVNGLPVLAPHPVEAQHIAELFGRVADGSLLVRDAGEWLTPRIGRPMRPNTVHKILRSPVYLGYISNKLTDNKPIQAAFKGLIDQATWDCVRGVLVAGGQIRSERPTDAFPLRGVIKCGCCGKLLTASESRGRSRRLYGYYHCPCSFRISVSKAEAAFAEYLRRTGLDCEAMLQLMREVVANLWQKTQDTAILEAENFRRQLAAVQAKTDKLIELYMAGGISLEDYKRKAADLDLAGGVLRTQIRDSEIDELDAETALNLATKLFQDLPTLFARTPAKDRKRLIKGVFGGPLTISLDGVVSHNYTHGIANILKRPAGSTNLRWHPQGESTGTTPVLAFLREIAAIADLCAA